MSEIPYIKDDPLSINVAFKCRKLGYFTAFMSCPACRYFPCSQLTEADVRILNISPLMDRTFKTFEQRSISTVHILKKFDGTLTLVEDLDEKNPDPELLRDVEEVYVINKVLVPVMTLRPKTSPKKDSGTKTGKDKPKTETAESSKKPREPKN